MVYAGGSVADLAARAAGQGVSDGYTLHEGDWLSFTIGAPELAADERCCRGRPSLGSTPP